MPQSKRDSERNVKLIHEAYVLNITYIYIYNRMMRSFSECWQPGNAWQPYRTAASRQPSHIAAVTLGEDHRRSQGPDILAIKIMFDCRWSMLIHAVHCTFSNQRMTDMRVAFCRDLSPSMGIFLPLHPLPNLAPLKVV